MTPAQIHFVEGAVLLALLLAGMFWCGWVARDGRVREAENKFRLAEHHADVAREIAKKWESNCDQWSTLALAAEAMLAEQFQIAFQAPAHSADISGPSASAAVPKTTIERKRGARGKFIKS